MSDPVLVVEDLQKTFKIGFARKLVRAVRGISFQVEPGTIFGFLGPNGAGKTTTMKMCMDLIRPTAGRIRLFGSPPGSMSARTRIGYLPEQPYFYDYLKPTELLDFFGRLYNVPRSVRRKRIDELMERVGLDHARERTLRKFSKGMLQRIGLAQALIGNPDLVVLDEPLSGLDPIGRKELKDVIVSLRQKGKTVFFSSHILADIELLCDQMAIIDKGVMRFFGPTSEFTRQGHKEVEIVASAVPQDKKEAIVRLAESVEDFGPRMKLLTTRERTGEAVAALVAAGASVDAVIPRSESLEEIFVRTAGEGGGKS
jgi:ABC-2 type transport system ATP-binding protein